MQYVPVLTGEASGLRAGVEGILDGDDQRAVNNQLSVASEELRKMGATATFGMEIECTFAPNPMSDIETPYADDPRELYTRIYEQVFERVQGFPMYKYENYTAWDKGQVIRPIDSPLPLMPNRYNGTYNTDPQEEICEFRTTPGEARTAQERYWNIIDAVGRVAAKNGLMALLLSTHVNGAVLVRDEHTGIAGPHNKDYFLPYDHYEGGSHIAATQHHLNASRPLQAAAGLREGWYVHEAYPHSKDASTTIHAQRLEYRHPAGMVDPRIDMLAALSGLLVARQDQLPEGAKDIWHEAASLEVMGDTDIAELLRTRALYDYRKEGFILPTQIEDAYLTPEANAVLGRLMAQITSGYVGEYTDAECHQMLVELVDSLGMSFGNVYLKAERERRYPNLSIGGIFAKPKNLQSYTSPELIYESPRTFVENREESLQHPAVRKMFGAAISSVIPARQTAHRRQQLVDDYMV